MARPKVSPEQKRRLNAERVKRWRTKNPPTAEEKVEKRVRDRLYQQTPAFKARAAAKYRARREALASHPRPDLCEICGQPPNGKGTLHWDHCHATGAFRGWLCHTCNNILGSVSDNPTILRKMADYLDRFPRPDGEYVPQGKRSERKHEPMEPLPLLDRL
jgi:hypothetical protein